MVADFVALDIVPSSDRLELAARLDGAAPRRLLFLIGHEPAAVLARQHADPGLEVVGLPNLPAAGAALVEAVGDAPWVSFDLADRLAALAEQDTDGWFGAIESLDAGDLASLVAPLLAGRDLADFLTLAGPEAVTPAPGMPTAEAIARLWRAAVERVPERPYSLQVALCDLLERGRHPLAGTWKSAMLTAPPEGQPTLVDSLLRERLRAITPAAVEPEEPAASRPIEVDEVTGWLAEAGLLAARMERYESRPGQIEMAAGVARALNQGRCLIVEAGTGTGKSLAYLAPALRFAVTNGTPVVVSTNTKNLQDQLRRKDLPLLEEALDFEFTAELVKGRGNYLCCEKLLDELAEAPLLPFEDQLWHLACLLSWAADTATGDFDELSGYLTWRYPHLLGYARGLASESETCTASSARHHPCFATVARRRAMGADLLVVNHALALANATVEVLPPFRHIIFDEAHNLEDIATEAFGLLLERRAVLGMLRELAGRDPRSFGSRLKRYANEAGEAAELLSQVLGLEQIGTAVSDGIEDLGEQLGGLVMQRLGRSVDELTRAEKLRLDPSVWDSPLGASLQTAATNLKARLGELLQSLTGISVNLQMVTGEAEGDGAELQSLRVTAQARLQDWTEQVRALDLLVELNDERFVYWLEFALRRDAWEWRLKAAPIEAGEALAERVYRQMETVVLTSATLTVGDRFDYFVGRLGLGAEGVRDRLEQLQVPSSFDYRRQVLLGLPTNIALPRDDRFDLHCATAIEDLAQVLDGRTLCLFTALGAMRRTYDRLAERLTAVGIEPLCQGVSGSRHALADRFRRNPHSVLFGTRSFWEGIDVPGDALRCVVIVKLPFTVPDDPVHAARCERLEALGINAWSAYSIPQAVILFKQGFGRLIRTSTDRGAVIVLDRRLKEKSYGRAFLRSVPGYHGVFDSWSEVKYRVREWLEHPDSPRPVARVEGTRP